MRSHDGRLNLFRDYARRRWGETVGKISLHAGSRCPNRERGGCVYCSAASYLPYYLKADDPVPQQIVRGKGFLRRLGTRRFFACFQHETSTAGDFAELLPKFLAPLGDSDCVGLTISTRPDCLVAAQLDQLQRALSAWPDKPAIIELGLQSAHDTSLAGLNRHHTADDFAQAVALLAQFPRFDVGVHLILGLPAEGLPEMRQSIQFVASQGISHLKLHHLQVVKETPLFDRYAAHPFPLPTADEYIEWLCDLLPRIPPATILHRLWGYCRSSLLHQPRWNLDSNQLFGRLFRRLDEHNLTQGMNVSA